MCIDTLQVTTLNYSASVNEKTKVPRTLDTTPWDLLHKVQTSMNTQRQCFQDVWNNLYSDRALVGEHADPEIADTYIEAYTTGVG